MGKYGKPPPTSCKKPTDPLKKPKSPIESWFTEQTFADLFPKANIGWGPSDCRPYNYKAFAIAARYFPKFGTEHFSTDPEGRALHPVYSAHDTYRRDIAAFLSHATQETGENDPSLYKKLSKKEADACFYRGAFFNWFYPCGKGKSGQFYTGCYYGRGAIQISYNFNYGLFQQWLR